MISGLEDFARSNKGDFLVAQPTSPIWTPLLSIAAAAVTEAGDHSLTPRSSRAPKRRLLT